MPPLNRPQCIACVEQTLTQFQECTFSVCSICLQECRSSISQFLFLLLLIDIKTLRNRRLDIIKIYSTWDYDCLYIRACLCACARACIWVHVCTCAWVLTYFHETLFICCRQSVKISRLKSERSSETHREHSSSYSAWYSVLHCHCCETPSLFL